jgi:aryl carrier-like protein
MGGYFKLDIKNLLRAGLDWIRLGDFCENDNEHWGSTKAAVFFDQLTLTFQAIPNVIVLVMLI